VDALSARLLDCWRTIPALVVLSGDPTVVHALSEDGAKALWVVAARLVASWSTAVKVP